MSAEQGSVTRWITLIREGKQEALDAFSKRYFSKIRNLAKSRLSKSDSEEIANDVLVALTKSIAAGKYPDLADRTSLWYLILKITQRRVIAFLRRDKAQRRIPADAVEGRESEVFINVESLTDYETELDEVIAAKSTDAAWIEISDCWEELLRCLPDDECRKIAQLKLEYYSNREIAMMLRFTPSMINRKVHIIQSEWQRIAMLDDKA
ncbi:MAG: ECF-type sigma factor [Pirellula sp.]|nr:ECF-type sigma factor [Pirellula sp.]